MENHIQNIELINKYLDKSLSENESNDFFNRLKTDLDFKELYEQHSLFLEGLKRQTLRSEIKIARQYYVRTKWLKFLGISTSIVVASILTYLFLVNNISVEPKPIPKNNDSIIISDSIPAKENNEREVFITDTLSVIKKESIKEVEVLEKQQPVKELISLKSLKKVPQTFIVNSQKDTTIVCNEGTKLNIKANSFVDARNNVVEGNISIAVTEYYKVSDMLLANLSTTSDDKQLETGGMLFIEAKINNTDLKLAEKASVEILFPTQNKKDNMQLFSGDWKDGIINWQLQKSREEVVAVGEVEIEEEDIQVPFAIVEEVPIFSGCENIDKDLIKKCTRDAINNFIKTNFDESILQEIDAIGRHNIGMQFNINQEGNVVDIQVTASHIKLAQEGVRVLESMSKMKPGKQRGKEVSVVYTFPMSFMVGNSLKINNRNPIKLKSRTTSDIEFEEKLKTEDRATITTQEVSNYVFSTSQLGWINCDRFTNRNNRIKYKLKVKKEDGTKVNMVFKSLNSILPSRYLEGFDFGYIAKDEDVVIVAIKMKEDKVYLDIIDAKTEASPDLKFHFKEVTIQEMKDELKNLNKLFE